MKCYLNYGPLKVGQEYCFVSEGYDYICVRAQGKMLYTPSYVFNPSSMIRVPEFDFGDESE